MAQAMKAFVMKRVGDVGVMDKPIPEPGPNDAVIRTTAALICTSDAHTVGGAIGERENITLGHEAVGVIHRLGNAVQGFKVGDRVAVNAITPCFHCENCLRGYSSQCGQMLGGWKFANVKDGNMAEYFHVNDARANLAPIPDGLPDEKAVYCADMLSTGFMGAEHANIPIGGTVAVFAQGPVGLMATVGARLLGAGLVIGVENVPLRQKLARHYGADESAPGRGPGRPLPDDDASLPLRRHREGLQDDADQGGRHHQAADHVRVRTPEGGDFPFLAGAGV